MVTQFELTNISAYRKLDNYKVTDHEVNNNNCLVCFSSNGLYFPNTNESLDSIIKRDKYEWENTLNTGFKRVIYIRDIYKQWYIEGINDEFNNIDKLKCLLAKLTNGYKCTFVGSSAGGYAATLFGGLLGAEKIFNFAGQFDISLVSKCSVKNQLIHKNRENACFNIKNTKANVFYFLPIKSTIDQEQYELIKNNTSVRAIKVNSGVHGVAIYPFALKKMIKEELPRLEALARYQHNKVLLSLKYATVMDLFIFTKNKFNKFINKYLN